MNLDELADYYDWIQYKLITRDDISPTMYLIERADAEREQRYEETITRVLDLIFQWEDLADTTIPGEVVLGELVTIWEEATGLPWSDNESDDDLSKQRAKHNHPAGKGPKPSA